MLPVRPVSADNSALPMPGCNSHSTAYVPQTGSDLKHIIGHTVCTACVPQTGNDLKHIIGHTVQLVYHTGNGLKQERSPSTACVLQTGNDLKHIIGHAVQTVFHKQEII